MIEVHAKVRVLNEIDLTSFFCFWSSSAMLNLGVVGKVVGE